MKFARRPRTEVELNLVSLIDVMLLLVIFFMVTTTFVRDSRLRIDLPQASSKAKPAAGDLIEITISKGGSYAINGVALVNTTASTLRRALEQTSQGRRDRALLLTADAATPHQAVITAMDVAGQLGFVNLSISTRQIEPEGGTP